MHITACPPAEPVSPQPHCGHYGIAGTGFRRKTQGMYEAEIRKLEDIITALLALKHKYSCRQMLGFFVKKRRERLKKRKQCPNELLHPATVLLRNFFEFVLICTADCRSVFLQTLRKRRVNETHVSSRSLPEMCCNCKAGNAAHHQLIFSGNSNLHAAV